MPQSEHFDVLVLGSGTGGKLTWRNRDDALPSWRAAGLAAHVEGFTEVAADTAVLKRCMNSP
jgi:hypothetical protein